MADRPGNRNYASRAPLVELFRLGSTYRWQVVHTDKEQSVAEHSHMVAVLVTRFCQVMKLEPDEYVLHAIFHDAEEAWIGDVATPAKRLMDKEKLPVDDMLGVFAKYYHPKTDLIRLVVKLADDVEAIRFLERYAKHKHGNQVQAKIADRMQETLDTLLWVTADPLPERGAICGIINSYIRGDDETFADDFT